MAYDLTARLRLIDNLTSPLRRAQRQIEVTGRVGTSSFGSVSAAIGKVAVGIGAVAAAAATAKFAFDSLNKAMDFEAQMSSIKALTGATNEEMQRMSDLAMKMGANTKYSALEAAQGIEELLKAGLTPAQVEAGGLQNALNLATAGGLELADAAEIMSTALNAFKRDALTAEDASNILAGTANASATSVQELRYSLAAVSAVAAGVGMSFRDTNTALGLFANNGLKGSDAGTSLKTMLSNLQPTTDTQIDLFKRLGIVTKSGANAFYDARGKLKGLDQISGILQKSLGKMTDQQRMLALETMFGSDAIRAATILYNEGADGVRKFQQEMSKVSALDVAKQKMDNAKGAIEQLSGALETIQISALQPLLPVIKDMALLFANMAEQYGPQIAATFENIGKSMREFLDPYLNDPKTWQVTGQAEFKFKQAEMMDAQAGPPPFWENLMGRFDEWYASTGRPMLERGAALVARDFAQLLQDNAGPIAAAGLDIGLKMALAIGDGIRQGLNDNTLGRSIVSGAMPWMNVFGNAKDIITSDGPSPGHFHGIDYVPRDGYQATLHKGERVLTARENQSLESSGGSAITISGNTFMVNAAGGDISNPKVIDSIAKELARQIAELQ